MGAPAKPLALTFGDPAGIGPEIALASWQKRHEAALPPFYLLGDAAALARRARRVGLDIPLAEVAASEAVATFDRALPVVDIGVRVTAEPGQPDASSAPAAITAITRAVADVIAGRAGAVVTNPIAKSVLYAAGLHASGPHRVPRRARIVGRRGAASGDDAVVGHAQRRAGDDPPAAARGDRGIDHRVDREDLPHHRRRTCAAALAWRGRGLRSPDSIRTPARMARSARRTRTIIAPAVAALRADGLDVRGPLPADTMFHAAARKSYDCAICMYHDQALIPIKTLAFDDGVNVTLGLPFVRTSPDHGTAFDIAGTGRANPSSLIAALKLAARMTADRAPLRHERDRRPAAAPRGDPAARAVGQKIARPEFPARSQSHRAHCARRGRHSRRRPIVEIGPGPGGSDARPARARRAGA